MKTWFGFEGYVNSIVVDSLSGKIYGADSSQILVFDINDSDSKILKGILLLLL
tara:strand:+ start:898 stop:1056 length:159 start_codon:yes stop_codon:yes gene_type:complete